MSCRTPTLTRPTRPISARLLTAFCAPSLPPQRRPSPRLRWLTYVGLLLAALPNSEEYFIVSLNVLVSHVFALASGASRRVRFAALTDGRQNHKVSQGLALCTAFQRTSRGDMSLLPLIRQSLGRVRLSYKCLSESFTFLSHLVPYHKRVYISMFSEVSTQHSTRY